MTEKILYEQLNTVKDAYIGNEWSEHMRDCLNNGQRYYRLQNKKIENITKPGAISSDILSTDDYIFSKKHDLKEGDSGPILIAYNRKNRKDKYLVKHYFTDCACNEYVYSKIANALGIKVPVVKLLTLSLTEKKKYFYTEYIAGIEYLEKAKYASLDFNSLLEKGIRNWQDYFKFMSLSVLLGDSDEIEMILTNDNYILKIDNTASLDICNFELESLGVDVELNGYNFHHSAIKRMNDKLDYWENDYSCFESTAKSFYRQIRNEYGNEYLVYYLEPFKIIQEISNDYIDGFLNTLCYIYPDALGDFYRRYLNIQKRHADKFLKDTALSQ